MAIYIALFGSVISTLMIFLVSRSMSKFIEKTNSDMEVIFTVLEGHRKIIFGKDCDYRAKVKNESM